MESLCALLALGCTENRYCYLCPRVLQEEYTILCLVLVDLNIDLSLNRENAELNTIESREDIATTECSELVKLALNAIPREKTECYGPSLISVWGGLVVSYNSKVNRVLLILLHCCTVSFDSKHCCIFAIFEYHRAILRELEQSCMLLSNSTINWYNQCTLCIYSSNNDILNIIFLLA